MDDYMQILQMTFRVTRSKFLAGVMTLRALSNKGIVIPPHFSPQSFRTNTAWRTGENCKPWVDEVHIRMPYALRQDSSTSFKDHLIQGQISNNLYDGLMPNLWPPNLPDLNLIEYVRNVIEWEITNNTRSVTEDPIVSAMFGIYKAYLVQVYQQFLLAFAKTESRFIG